jgi:hypothetical protein
MIGWREIEIAEAVGEEGGDLVELAAGDEQEVAGAAGGVEDVEIGEGGGEGREGLAGGGGDAALPGLDDRRADDAEDVGLGGVVGAVAVAERGVEAALVGGERVEHELGRFAG